MSFYALKRKYSFLKYFSESIQGQLHSLKDVFKRLKHSINIIQMYTHAVHHELLMGVMVEAQTVDR